MLVPDCSSMSRDLGIFVYQSTKPIVTLETGLGWRCEGWERLERCGLVECAVRATVVELRLIRSWLRSATGWVGRGG